MSVLFPDNPGTSIGQAHITNITDRIEGPPDWMEDIFPNTSFINGETHTVIRGVCRDVLNYQLPWFGLRYWDVAIFVPNFLFMLFLLLNSRQVCRKIGKSKSPVFKAFFALVYITTIMNVTRSVVSMTVSATSPLGELVDKILWISLKFFYMTAELCVLTFALLFGHLDSSTSIRRALFLTLLISLAHTAVQTALELRLVDEALLDNTFFDLQTEGGLVFWMMTSFVFALIYLFVLCLPLTCVRKCVTLPSRCSFYVYCVLLSLLNTMQALGAALLFFQAIDGMCFIDVSTYIYFCGYTPIVYMTFLRKPLKHPVTKGNGLFSYRKQHDESGSGDIDTYYPRFSGLTSPSYDDLFDCARDSRFNNYEFAREYLQLQYPDAPLMMSSAETAESTVTTRTDDTGDQRDSGMWAGSYESRPRQLRGLGANGTLVFDEPKWGN